MNQYQLFYNALQSNLPLDKFLKMKNDVLLKKKEIKSRIDNRLIFLSATSLILLQISFFFPLCVFALIGSLILLMQCLLVREEVSYNVMRNSSILFSKIFDSYYQLNREKNDLEKSNITILKNISIQANILIALEQLILYYQNNEYMQKENQSSFENIVTMHDDLKNAFTSNHFIASHNLLIQLYELVQTLEKKDIAQREKKQKLLQLEEEIAKQEKNITYGAATIHSRHVSSCD